MPSYLVNFGSVEVSANNETEAILRAVSIYEGLNVVYMSIKPKGKSFENINVRKPVSIKGKRSKNGGC